MATSRRTDAPRRLPLDAAILERQLPYDPAAEVGVLGSMMLKPDVCDDIAFILRADDFHDEAHQKLYKHLISIHEEGKKLDTTLLKDRLTTAGDYEAIGGAAYIGKIINAVPHAAHAIYYAEIVRAKATYRSLIYEATDILRDAYQESDEAKLLLSQAEQRIFGIMDKRSQTAYREMKDILQDAWDRLEARMEGKHTASGVDCGFARLDEQTGGLHPGELIILAARPSMGKTAFALNVAENVAVQQKAPVLFVSLEMSSLELADRLLCSMARVNGHRMRNGTLTPQDRDRLAEKSSALSQSPFFVDDSPSRTMTEIAAAARRIIRRHGNLGLIVIDYLQLIDPDNPRDPRQEQVARIARRLKGMARELKVPVMCLAQLNRQTEAGKDNIPRLSHLRESGAIEQDADVVMFVHREEYYQRGEAKEQYAGQAQIIVAKQRNGPVGDVDLEFHKDFTRFQDPTPERLQEFASYGDGGGGEGF
jgi:replicative DNA helicase